MVNYIGCQAYFVKYLTFVKDVDECDSNPCDNNAACTDTEGSFTCTCNVGFSGDGLSCSSKYHQGDELIDIK